MLELIGKLMVLTRVPIRIYRFLTHNFIPVLLNIVIPRLEIRSLMIKDSTQTDLISFSWFLSLYFHCRNTSYDLCVSTPNIVNLYGGKSVKGLLLALLRLFTLEIRHAVFRYYLISHRMFVVVAHLACPTHPGRSRGQRAS